MSTNSTVSGSNTFATLNGNFKEVYADNLENLIPEGLVLLKKISFVPRAKENGNFYNQPVILAQEHGMTFAGPQAGAFSLKDPVPGQIKNAQVQPSQMVLRGVMDYESAARAAKGRNAFIDATQHLIENMFRSSNKKLEVELMYGSMGLGVVSSVASLVITISTAEWAPGIWSGAENMVIDIYDATDTTNRGSATITAVDMDARTITVDAVPVGTVATDKIYFTGAKGNEMAGLHKILSNTGTLFNISASSYSLWKSSSQSASSGPLSFAIIQKAVSKAVEKGLDEKVCVLVNPRAWSNLLSDQAANRRFDSSYKVGKAETGNEAIEFYSQNGSIEIISSNYVKEGYAYLMAPKHFMRIGAAELTFKVPGRDEEFFLQLQSQAGYELRCYTDQALFCKAPAKQVLISSIVNS